MKVENTKQWCAELLKWAILITFGLTGLYVISPRYEFLVSSISFETEGTAKVPNAPNRGRRSTYMIHRCDRITGEIALTDNVLAYAATDDEARGAYRQYRHSVPVPNRLKDVNLDFTLNQQVSIDEPTTEEILKAMESLRKEDEDKPAGKALELLPEAVEDKPAGKALELLSAGNAPNLGKVICP